MSLVAITREVSPSINACELSFHSRTPIDVTRAVEQHKAYANCLAELGARVVSLPPEPELPDAVFVEDTSLLFDEVAVIARMGASSRQAETTTIAKVLGDYRPLKFLTAPATLDGGDVLTIGHSLFVGLSRRTNQEGIEQLKSFLTPCGYDVQPVTVSGCLHLKSACSYVGNNTILINPSWIDAEPLRRFTWLEVAREESAAANALLLNEVVIMPSSFPKTRALLDKRGFRVRALDLSELQKAEAGVTCCSLLLKDYVR